MKKISINGDFYRRAVEFALLSCPAGGDGKLGHVVFIGNRVVGADGRSWFVSHLPKETEYEEPIVIARGSLDELLEDLQYAQRKSKRHGWGFFVEQRGPNVVTHYGDHKLELKLSEAKVGFVPEKFKEPFPLPPKSAELSVTDLPEVACGGPVQRADNFWKKHDARVSWRGQGADKPFRGDVRIGKERVGVVYALPDNHHSAVLPADEPLLQGADRKGQSILDLTLDIIKLPESPKVIKIGDREWNIHGLGHARDLLKNGPCSHRDVPEPCAQCTEIAVTQAKSAAETKVEKPKKRAKSDKADGENEKKPKAKK